MMKSSALKAYVAARYRLATPRRGATFIEYMLLVVIAIVIFGFLYLIAGDEIKNLVEDIGDELRKR